MNGGALQSHTGVRLEVGELLLQLFHLLTENFGFPLLLTPYLDIFLLLGFDLPPLGTDLE